MDRRRLRKLIRETVIFKLLIEERGPATASNLKLRHVEALLSRAGDLAKTAGVKSEAQSAMSKLLTSAARGSITTTGGEVLKGPKALAWVYSNIKGTGAEIKAAQSFVKKYIIEQGLASTDEMISAFKGMGLKTAATEFGSEAAEKAATKATEKAATKATEKAATKAGSGAASGVKKAAGTGLKAPSGGAKMPTIKPGSTLPKPSSTTLATVEQMVASNPASKELAINTARRTLPAAFVEKAAPEVIEQIGRYQIAAVAEASAPLVPEAAAAARTLGTTALTTTGTEAAVTVVPRAAPNIIFNFKMLPMALRTAVAGITLAGTVAFAVSQILQYIAFEVGWWLGTKFHEYLIGDTEDVFNGLKRQAKDRLGMLYGPSGYDFTDDEEFLEAALEKNFEGLNPREVDPKRGGIVMELIIDRQRAQRAGVKNFSEEHKKAFNLIEKGYLSDEWIAKAKEARKALDQLAREDDAGPMVKGEDEAVVKDETDDGESKPRKSGGNSKVKEIQKIVGARTDGIWGRETEGKVAKFVKDRITAMNVDGKDQRGTALKSAIDRIFKVSWQNNIGRVKDVEYVEKKADAAAAKVFFTKENHPRLFKPTIDGYLEFLRFIDQRAKANVNETVISESRGTLYRKRYRRY